MNTFNPTEHPHRRYNPLTGDWILVSPHRTQRPWKGQVERPPHEDRPSYDPACYLCPGNERAGGVTNLAYTSMFVFTNDFAALLPDTPAVAVYQYPLLRAETARGTSRVICFSPRHDLTLVEMPEADSRTVIDVWAAQTTELARKYRWVQVFENRGAIIGSSHPHLHGQIWAGSALPNEPAKEEREQRAYFATHDKPLLLAYAAVEAARGAARCRRKRALAGGDALLDRLAVRDAGTPTPSRHALPRPRRRGTGCAGPGAQAIARQVRQPLLHAHFYLSLLRSATVKKFIVGYEMLGEAQRDLTAEQAAARLRDLSEIHFKE